MKKLNLALAILGAGLALTACVNRNEPKEVADKFLQALSENNYGMAKKYATQRTDKLLEVMSSVAKLAPEHTKKEYQIVDQKVNGDRALIQYRTIGTGDVETLTLIRKHDQWLVGTMD